MGLLTVGQALSWYETKTVIDHVKYHGILQFINVYRRVKDRRDDRFKWGDEIEYMVVKFDHENKKVRLSLRGEEILNQLTLLESSDPTKNEFLWRPECAAYMLEGTPGQPYSGFMDCFKAVEQNMRLRRHEASKYLESDEILLTIGSFPRVGCLDFTSPPYKTTPNEGMLHSLFFPDQAINGHPRFKNISINIHQRRGGKVAINVPIYRDENTPKPFIEDFKSMGDDGQAARNAKPDHIYMDSIGFGMGCCCLQVTFQTINVNEARWLYDQLTPLTPVLLALSASTPIFRGYLADVDSRWNIIAASVDDRTEEERGLLPLKENKFVIPKSRYDTTDWYLYSCSSGYNDVPLQYDQKYLDMLQQGGVDEQLAKHVAHLFIRDPLLVFRERIDQNDEKSIEHFETIQSSNWMNMRFKPPPPDSPEIGWRVEFRPIEVQLTDFENAAYVCFIVLLTRVIISFRLTFLIPISKVNENMLRAQKRDAVLNEKLYFRRKLTACDNPPESPKIYCDQTDAVNSEAPKASDDYVEMTVSEIINGRPPDFPGLIALIYKFLDSAEVDVDTRCTIEQYLRFIQLRASGKTCTLAHWMRRFVITHPAYKKDSVVSEEINYDLVKTMVDIAQGRMLCPSLLGDLWIKSGGSSVENDFKNIKFL